MVHIAHILINFRLNVRLEHIDLLTLYKLVFQEYNALKYKQDAIKIYQGKPHLNYARTDITAQLLRMHRFNAHLENSQ